MHVLFNRVENFYENTHAFDHKGSLYRLYIPKARKVDQRTLRALQALSIYDSRIYFLLLPEIRIK